MNKDRLHTTHLHRCSNTKQRATKHENIIRKQQRQENTSGEQMLTNNDDKLGSTSKAEGTPHERLKNRNRPSSRKHYSTLRLKQKLRVESLTVCFWS